MIGKPYCLFLKRGSVNNFNKYTNFERLQKLTIKKKVLKILTICLFIFLFLSPIISASFETYIIADEITAEEREEAMKELQENILNQLEDLNFEGLEEILKNLDIQGNEIFGSASFKDKILSLISGQFTEGKASFWEALIALFFDDLLALLPIMATVVAIAISGGMLQGLRPTSNSKSIQDVIHFVTYGIIVVVLLGVTVKMVTMTGGVITSIKNQMDAIFPILLTLLTALGGTVSVSVYQPAMALLTGTILNFFSYILLPLFIFSIVFSVVSNLSNTVKLDKFTSFFHSTFKWLSGLIFTIFSAFISIQGITAGSVDGISIKTAKYAIRSYVPILGSYISDGLSIIIASSSLIKNAVGAAGLLLLLATIISPLIKLIIFMLALKLMSAIIEPLGNSKVANFISGISKSMVLLIAIIIGVAFIYFIMLGLIMCSANIF